jgi:hypothetical protein
MQTLAYATLAPSPTAPPPLRDENSRKTSKSFSTFTFEYENKSESGKVRHENEHEPTEYLEF